MKVAVRRSTFNFYESFSDLIFCALVLFVVLVLFLVLNVNKGVMTLRQNEAEHQEAVAALEKEQRELEQEKDRHARQTVEMIKLAAKVRKHRIEIARIMGVNRFTGRTGPTDFLLLLKVYSGGYTLIPVPNKVFLNWGVTINNESIQEASERTRLEALEIARQGHELSLDEMRDLFRCVQRHSDIAQSEDGSGTGYISYTWNWMANNVVSGWTSVSGEVLVDDLRDRMVAQGAYVYEEFSRKKVVDVHPVNPPSLPVLMFSVSSEDQEILLGRSIFSPSRFRRILEAFGGAGLIVEYVPGKEDPVKIPDWVVTEVLVPVGYINRAPDVSSFSLAE